MPTFNVHLSYTDSANNYFGNIINTVTCKSPEDARKMTVAAFKPHVINVKKIKLVRVGSVV